MNDGNSTEVRILFAVLEEGHPALVRELVAGEWVEVNSDAYFEIADDLYLTHGDDGGLVWSDNWGFTTTAIVEPGEPPVAEEASATARAFLEHLRLEDEEAELEGVILVHDGFASE